MSEQRTPEWFAKRAGAITASRMGDLMARLKNGAPGASRKDMITTLAVERLTGQCVETYSNEAMRRGTELEPQALDAYAFAKCETVESIDYVQHPEIPMVGCSPDGLVGDVGLVEVKCPSAMGKHLDALQTGGHAVEYRWQLQHQLFVTRREWVDAVSYDPRFPSGLQLAIVRVEPNAEDQADIAAEIAKSNPEIDALVEELTALGKAAA